MTNSFSSALFLLITALAVAPVAAQTATTPTTPTTQTTTVPAGSSAADSNGTSVNNVGTNGNGRVQVRHTGKAKRNPDGTITITGEIVEVTNPASQGSVGPIEIENHYPGLVVNLNKRGGNPNPISTSIDGGGATVNVTGSGNDVAVGGTGNTVSITGANCNGSGGNGSGGTVSVSGTGSGFTSTGGGTWRTVR